MSDESVRAIIARTTNEAKPAVRKYRPKNHDTKVCPTCGSLRWDATPEGEEVNTTD